MKGVLILLMACLASGAVFDHCPYTMDNIPETVKITDVMGGWYHIRKGPVPEEVAKIGSFDCIRSVLWREYKGPENTFSYLHYVRKDMDKHIAKSITFDLEKKDELHVNNFVVSKTIHLEEGGEDVTIDVQEKLVETDEGKKWSLWAACITKEGNSTLVWSIKSRCPAMDAKLEQTLVEKVEKYGGVGPSQLRGIGQTDCTY